MAFVSSIQNGNSALKQENVRKRLIVDFFLFLAISFIGWLCIFSIEYTANQNVWNELLSLKKNYARQLLWIIMVLCLGVIILNLRSVLFTMFATVSYFTGIGIMVLIIFFGTYTRGSYSWVNVGGVQIQFAEIMILLTALFLSKYVSNIDFNIQKKKHRLFSIMIFLTPFLLTAAQRELGLGLVFFSFILVLYREGLPLYFLMIPLYLLLIGILSIAVPPLIFLIGAIALGLLVFFIFMRFFLRNKAVLLITMGVLGITIFLQSFLLPWTMQRFLEPYQIKRVYSTFGLKNAMDKFSEADIIDDLDNHRRRRNDNNYNVLQSIVAIGSGGFMGKGFLKNTQTRLNFVPERATDFIFCSYAESFGFIGSLTLLILYGWMMLRMLQNAENQRNVQVRAYTYGFVSVLAFHTIVNLGMTIGLLPVIGIPLPFVSYGGSSFITFGLMYFIMLRLQTSTNY